MRTSSGGNMLRSSSAFFSAILVLLLSLSLSGCTVIFQKGRRVDVEKISKLKNELSDLERAKAELEDRLKNEIADKEVQVKMAKDNLVITFVAEVLFDSGKADLKSASLEMIDKVAKVLNDTVPDLSVGIEGHTDNQPIKYSSWKSNWELSSGRALSVVHYLQDVKGINPERLAAIGHGEYKPVESNDTKEGRQKNRRVEVVILPPATVKGR